MCTKAYEEDGQAVTSGCFTQSHSGRDVSVCLCQTVAGSAYPCNKAETIFRSSFILLILLLSVSLYVL